MVTNNPFCRSGLASLDDLETEEWLELYEELESVQHEFATAKPHCPDYPWPKDALHAPTRLWEYPFAFHHLKTIIDNGSRGRLTAVDFGSGATFFPFSVARLGYDVLAVDGDPRATESLAVAKRTLDTNPGTVKTILSDARETTIPSESVDAVYCISVLEHIPDFTLVLKEIYRILAPTGFLILTVDVDIAGTFELGPKEFKNLQYTVNQLFEPVHGVSVIHPLRVLDSDNSPYPMYPVKTLSESLLAAMKGSLRPVYRYIKKMPVTRKTEKLLVTTYGTCVRKRDR